jgi:hypothetical protein
MIHDLILAGVLVTMVILAIYFTLRPPSAVLPRAQCDIRDLRRLLAPLAGEPAILEIRTDGMMQ